jgi:hypothetical protein
MITVKVKTANQGGLSRAYLTLFNGSLKLTEKELGLLSLLLDKYVEFKEEGLKEPFLSKFVFSTETKKEVQKISKTEPQYFQNILASLVKKGPLISKGFGQYTFDSMVIPRREIAFKFE